MLLTGKYLINIEYHRLNVYVNKEMHVSGIENSDYTLKFFLLIVDVWQRSVIQYLEEKESSSFYMISS